MRVRGGVDIRRGAIDGGAWQASNKNILMTSKQGGSNCRSFVLVMLVVVGLKTVRSCRWIRKRG